MWIIGYKGWGALLGKRLADCGFVVLSIDYRNFPQGGIGSMEADVANGISWCLRHCSRFGGNRSRVSVVGQSAGAHIAALALTRQAVHESENEHSLLASSWPIADVNTFIGISGIYGLDNADLLSHFESRGLKASTVKAIMDNRPLEDASPVALAKNAMARNNAAFHMHMPPTVLLHGSADRSAPPSESALFAASLRQIGTQATERYYPGMSHTDPFIECPILGGEDALVRDVADAALLASSRQQASTITLHSGHEAYECSNGNATPHPSSEGQCHHHAPMFDSAAASPTSSSYARSAALECAQARQLEPAILVQLARLLVPF